MVYILSVQDVRSVGNAEEDAITHDNDGSEAVSCCSPFVLQSCCCYGYALSTNQRWDMKQLIHSRHGNYGR